MSISLPALALSRGWLSVAVASSTDKDRPQLDRTVYIEQYPRGVKLTATNTYVLLTTWVPDVEHDLEPEPSDDEIPYATAVARDPYGRAAGLLAHLGRIGVDEDGKDLGLEVAMHLNVPWQADETPADELQLDGFAALAVTLEQPGVERVQLEVYEGNWVGYRELLARHRKPRGLKGPRSSTVALSQGIAARLAKAAKFHGGELVPIRQRLTTEDGPLLVAFGSEPEVSGLAMPIRWDFVNDIALGEDQ